MTTVAPLAHIRGIRAALVETVIELDSLGKRAHTVSPDHRPVAAAVQSHANQLAVLLMRAMAPTPDERAALKDFFDVRLVACRSGNDPEPQGDDELDDDG